MERVEAADMGRRTEHQVFAKFSVTIYICIMTNINMFLLFSLASSKFTTARAVPPSRSPSTQTAPVSAGGHQPHHQEQGQHHWQNRQPQKTLVVPKREVLKNKYPKKQRKKRKVNKTEPCAGLPRRPAAVVLRVQGGTVTHKARHQDRRVHGLQEVTDCIS